jgi:hypothetical protein
MIGIHKGMTYICCVYVNGLSILEKAFKEKRCLTKSKMIAHLPLDDETPSIDDDEFSFISKIQLKLCLNNFIQQDNFLKVVNRYS